MVWEIDLAVFRSACNLYVQMCVAHARVERTYVKQFRKHQVRLIILTQGLEAMETFNYEN